jgi:hypothetical protein
MAIAGATISSRERAIPAPINFFMICLLIWDGVMICEPAPLCVLIGHLASEEYRRTLNVVSRKRAGSCRAKTDRDTQ